MKIDIEETKHEFNINKISSPNVSFTDEQIPIRQYKSKDKGTYFSMQFD